MFVSKLPLQHSHAYFEDEGLGLYVGLWDTDEMIEAAGPYACDEFMWVLDGEAEIQNQKTGVRERARAGEAFIIPRGYDCQWHQQGYLRKYYVIYEPPEENKPSVPTREGIVIAGKEISGSPASAQTPFHSADGEGPREDICYRNTSGKFLTGTWASEGLTSAQKPFPFNEFFCVYDGSITIKERGGMEHVFKAGDAFFIPQGVECSAVVEAGAKIYFAIVRAR